MITLKLRYENSNVPKQELVKVTKKLESELELFREVRKNGDYSNERSFINLPFDHENIKATTALAKEKLKLKPAAIFVVGIGGSILGTLAVQEAVLGKLYNESGKGTKVFYVDTLDPLSIATILHLINGLLKKGQKVLINIVSKSGTTTETIANFELLEWLLKKHSPKKYQSNIIATTDRDSKLWRLAIRNGWSLLEIPKKVGGRYSVLSAVGLFPLALLRTDIKSLVDGAAEMAKYCLKQDQNIMSNPAVIGASLAYIHYKKGKPIHDLFLWSPNLEGIGKWWRQLVGEGLAKEFDLNGKRVFEGITPTVSIGSNDMHSMAPLYLAGPFDKWTTFVRVIENKESPRLPVIEEYERIVPKIQGKRIDELRNTILDGVQAAYKKNKRPFAEITLPDLSTKSIGQFIMLKMIETVLIGSLLNVNPFDQPAVEKYKAETRVLLAKRFEKGNGY
ncbi:MAG: hypothetical protein QW559_00330 [Candidatus Woesearchaeota archaeon]